MVEMLSKMTRICGVDARGAASGSILERTCIVEKEMMYLSQDNLQTIIIGSQNDAIGIKTSLSCL